MGNTILQNTNILKEIQDNENHSENMINSVNEVFRHGLQALYINRNDPSIWKLPMTEHQQDITSKNHTE